MIGVCACETQPIVIEGLRSSLEDADDLIFAGAESTTGAVLELIERERPRVCLIDKALGTKAVFQLISDLKARDLETEPVLWAAEVSEVESFRALQVGARGILKKTLPVGIILDCLRTVAKGNIWIESSVSNQFVGFINRRSTPRLTPREEEILTLVMRGMKNKQIADALCITTGTVKVHLMHIFEKTGVKDRFELAMYGRRIRGLSSDMEDELSMLSSGDSDLGSF
ncbi:MAG: response regulator [Acidobacteria bacterium]|nr:response regulator [Acidobacteriota bacterium]